MPKRCQNPFYCGVVASVDFSDDVLLCDKLEQLMANQVPYCSFIFGGTYQFSDMMQEYCDGFGYAFQLIKTDWYAYGKKAPRRRNDDILSLLDSNQNSGLIAFWNGEPDGVYHLILRAKSLNIETRVIRF